MSNIELTLYESIVDVMTTRNHGDMLTSAQRLTDALRREIRSIAQEAATRDLDEELDNAYLAAIVNEPQPEPPAFAVGTRVRVKNGGYEGSILDARGNGSVYVKMDTVIHPFWREADELELVSDTSWATEGQRVKVLGVGDANITGVIISKENRHTGFCMVQIDGDDEPISLRPSELEPLREPAALPEGVTRDENMQRIEWLLDLPATQLKKVGFIHNKQSKTSALGILQAEQISGATNVTHDELKALIAMLQAIEAEMEATNGR